MDIKKSLSAVGEKITDKAGIYGLKLKQVSPELLLVAGVAGTVVTIVAACKATLKADDILEEAKETISDLETANAELPEYTDESKEKDIRTVKIQAAKKIAKTYAPTIFVGSASVMCILGSHDIMRKRNAALSAAYLAVETAYSDYRQRVVERLGKEMDRELRFNVQEKQVEETEVNAKGKEKVVTKTVKTAEKDRSNHDDYARCFDEWNPMWKKNRDLNVAFLRQAKALIQEKLQSKRYMTLNEVYEYLGFEPTAYGNIMGWVYKSQNKHSNYVDFGLDDLDNEMVRRFLQGKEDAVWLDFNCYNIWDDPDIFNIAK